MYPAKPYLQPNRSAKPPAKGAPITDAKEATAHTIPITLPLRCEGAVRDTAVNIAMKQKR